MGEAAVFLDGLAADSGAVGAAVQSTIFDVSVRPRAPPKAVPFHARPVPSWKGRVAISFPASVRHPGG